MRQSPYSTPIHIDAAFTLATAAYNFACQGCWLGRAMTRPSRPVVGRWRIVKADLWDRDYLDLCGPATLVIGAHGQGQIAFGAMQAGLDIDYGPNEIGFTWSGFDQMDEVTGSGSAELQDDGALQIEFE